MSCEPTHAGADRRHRRLRLKHIRMPRAGEEDSAESVTTDRCAWADRPAGDERSANNLHPSKAAAGQRSASCHVLTKLGQRRNLPGGGHLCRACGQTDEAKQIFAADKKAREEDREQKVDKDAAHW